MKPRQMERITKDPTKQEKSRSAALVSRYASIGGVLVLTSGYFMKYGVGAEATDKAAMKVGILLMFLSAVCLGSGFYALQELKERKKQILMTMLVSVGVLVIFLTTTFM